MLILMQNYGVFTKFVVLQDPRSKETKRARKADEKTKAGNNCRENSIIVTTKQKANKRKFVATIQIVATKAKKKHLKFVATN